MADSHLRFTVFYYIEIKERKNPRFKSALIETSKKTTSLLRSKMLSLREKSVSTDVHSCGCCQSCECKGNSAEVSDSFREELKNVREIYLSRRLTLGTVELD